ncbi:MAG: nucleotidyltransferase family protein [Acidimicrobiales bacterium]
MAEQQATTIPQPEHEDEPARDDRRFAARSPLGERLAAKRGEVLALAARRQASNVRVFGSVVRGSDGPSSDIDLLVDLPPDARPLDIIELECDLEAELGVRVDVGTAASLRPFLRDDVLAEAVAL